jgi:hypothetical protein
MGKLWGRNKNTKTQTAALAKNNRANNIAKNNMGKPQNNI